MEGQKGTQMEEAEVTIKCREMTPDGIKARERVWVIPHKHLFALTDFLDWAQKRGKKIQKTQELYVSRSMVP